MGVFAEEEFELLDENERKYVYYMSRAGWEGVIINFFQKSYESPAIFLIFQLTFQGCNMEDFKKQLMQNYKQDGYDKFMAYVSGFYNNCGNYKSTDDSKFIPELDEEKFLNILNLSPSFDANKDLITSLFESIKDLMYSKEGRYKQIGLPPF
jgi:dipeptidyl-peptidase III